jgi:flavin-dependent dehydrogenase
VRQAEPDVVIVGAGIAGGGLGTVLARRLRGGAAGARDIDGYSTQSASASFIGRKASRLAW